ncbi:RNA polymerase sigma-70 factor [Brevibacillus sp. SYSU BS000544]|uniref:RNA polymerase sigma-70 factor n=1 Tax=Brevibacillus sp. SYSU BS000544 TaxID=3416443 RepID=UPI003CE52723
MNIDNLYRSYKPLLYSIGYRMLGSVSDAEDTVQDVFLHLNQIDLEKVENMKAYLTKMMTNRCLNLLKSSRMKRELYTGPWLPEPEVQFSGGNPLEQIVKDETVSYAFLLLLEQLTPIERAVFILKEALDYDYGTIAEVVEKTESNCRQIYSRVKKKLQHESPVTPSRSEYATQLVTNFIKATRTGNFDAFLRVLTDNAILLSDGGGKVRSALRPIYGNKRIMAFWQGISKKGSLSGELKQVIINGAPGILVIRDGRLAMTICFEFHPNSDQVHRIYAVTNPDKLKHISF